MARVEPAVASGGLLKLYQALWAPYYQAALSVLGSTGVILPIGDPHHGQPNATTFTTKGEEQVTFTWSEPPASFDTPLDLTDPDSFQGIMPTVDFNGTDEEADSPDAAYWSRDDSAGEGMSLGVWVNMPNPSANVRFLAKWDSTPTAEWQWFIHSSDVMRWQMRDISAGVQNQRASDAAIPFNQWVFLAITYDGTGGATAQSGVTFYEDGAVMASTATESGSYVAMENGTGVVQLAFAQGIEFYDGKMAGGPLGPFFTQKELTADEVRALYDLGRAGLAL